MDATRIASLQERFRNPSRARLFAVLAAGAFLVAVAVVVRLVIARQPSSITVSYGNAEGLPILKLMSLDGEVPGANLRARAVVTEGSLEMLERVDRGELDFAIIQGSVDIDRFQNVRQVTGLTVIPLILLVKEELHAAVVADLGALRGKSVNLGSGRRTGTYWLSRELLSFAGLAPGAYQATHLTIPQLLGKSDRNQLPDAVFIITSPPARLVRHLAIEHRFKIVPLPYGDAFRAHALAEPSGTPADGIVVRKEHVADAIIPAFSYGVSPAIPPHNIATVGSRLLLITHRRTGPGEVSRVLEALLASRWASAMQPSVDKGVLQLAPEIAQHPGAVVFRDRDQPLITVDSVSFLSNALQILIPLAGGLLFLRGWVKNRKSAHRERSFDQFLDRVSAIERQACALKEGESLDDRALYQLHRELSDIKESAFQYFAGQEPAALPLAAILLAHITDVRASLGELDGHVWTKNEG
jgi:TRAP-type uncharacterized transport system substrate-binding protein